MSLHLPFLGTNKHCLIKFLYKLYFVTFWIDCYMHLLKLHVLHPVHLYKSSFIIWISTLHTHTPPYTYIYNNPKVILTSIFMKFNNFQSVHWFLPSLLTWYWKVFSINKTVKKLHNWNSWETWAVHHCTRCFYMNFMLDEEFLYALLFW